MTSSSCETARASGQVTVRKELKSKQLENNARNGMTERRWFTLPSLACYLRATIAHPVIREAVRSPDLSMNLRTRLVITAAALCHLLVAPSLVTSQLLASYQPGAARFTVPAFSANLAAQSPERVVIHGTDKQGQAFTIRTDSAEKAGDVYTLRGAVEIDFRNYQLSADEITYNAQTGDTTATGHMELTGGPHDVHIQAARGLYNVQTEKGRFYHVVGTTGMRVKGKRTVLTSSNPFMFTGELVDKTSPDRFIVHHGIVTVCDEPVPAWSFNAQRVIVDVGEDAQIYHSTFRLKGLPLFYFPYVARPVEALGRQSGFLIPTIGQSSRKGTVLGESFYWAINRSADATIGAEYFSQRGWAQHGNFRARPSENSFVEATYFGVLDRGLGAAHTDQGGEDVHLTAEGLLPLGIRAVADIEYLSSFVFRLAFTENFSQAVNSEVKSAAFLSRTWDGFSLNSLASRYQNFQSTTPGDLVTIVHAPSFETSSVERSLAGTPIHWSYEAAAEGLSRREPGFVTSPVVGRFDLSPRASVPMLFRGWTVRPELALRETYYTQRVVPNGSLGVPLSADTNRRALETSVEIRPPALGRIFERKVRQRTLKHTIEPRIVYRYVNGVDNFSSIIRFDARDIFSNTNELEYAVVNRLYAKRHSVAGDCPPPDTPVTGTTAQPPGALDTGLPPLSAACDQAGSVREIVTWEIAQKAFFDRDFGGAVVNGRRNVLTTTADFTGIAFLTEPRAFSPIISRLRVHTSNNTDVQWNLDYDSRKGRINASTAIAQWRFGEYFVGGSHAFLHAPGEIFVSNPIPGPDKFNQFRVLAGYGHPNKRGLSIAGNVGVDTNFNFLQYSTAQTSYNWDCIGVSVEYRRLALGSVRNENQFRFSLSLANVGTFGTLRRQERLF
jgi:LPS-assembly protein